MADQGRGSGSQLPSAIIITSGVLTVVATLICATSITLQLKSYRKPILQRQVVRIMLLVPIYSIASLISLFSLEAAFVIDVVRDLYEAFVIYCFFNLLLAYLGGERSTLILLHGRPPKPNVFPASIFKRELDLSDPFTFLFLKRGILQYVQIKPLLAIITFILKATGSYNEGNFRRDSGYLYVSIIYNFSVCLALYCLGMFWMCIHEDIKPFRPVPKFLCIKGVLFACFWQSLLVSLLVSVGVITRVGPYTDPEHISLAINDTLICFEMPAFALAHMYAFSHTDYIDPHTQYAARMPFYYALRDAFGVGDIIADFKATVRGGVSYQAFEPVEGGMHQGSGRDRRIRAGLRYAAGGQQKYWLPMPDEEADPTSSRSPGNAMRKDGNQLGYSPLLGDQADNLMPEDSPRDNDDDDGFSLVFGSPPPDEIALYEDSRNLLFGDYNYPCVDVSGEEARRVMWEEEERILSDERAAAFTSRIAPTYGYGAIVRTRPPAAQSSRGKEPIRTHGIYGGWAEHDGRRDISSRRDTLFNTEENYDQIQGPAIIDLEHDRIPSDFLSSGLKLSWTKTNLRTPEGHSGSLPRSRTSSKPSIPIQPKRSPAGVSKLEEGSIKHPSSLSLRSDAIDLIVEDTQSAEREMTWERRKGETATRVSAQRKVYKPNPIRHNEGDESGFNEENNGGYGQARGRDGDEPNYLRTPRDPIDRQRRSNPELAAADPFRAPFTAVEPSGSAMARDSMPPRIDQWANTRSFDEEENPWA